MAPKTGVSGDIDLIELTPPKVESDLVKVARKSVGLKEHYDSHESYQKRLLLKQPLLKQDPGTRVLTTDNGVVLPDTLWDENVKFKRYTDDSKSFEVEDIILGMDDLHLRHLFAEPKQSLDVDEFDLCLEQLFTEVEQDPVYAYDLHLDLLFTEVEQNPDYFGEQHIDPDELAVEINERNRNKLYDIFIKPGLRLPQTPTNLLPCTPTKRKRSPTQQSESPALRQRVGMLQEVDRNRAMSLSTGLRTRPQRRNRIRSLGSVQNNKITKHFRPAQDQNKQV